MTANAHHLSQSNEHGSPPEYVEAARRTMGSIDLDPATSAIFNRVVRARRIFDAHTNGLGQVWSGNVWLNPPGGKDGQDSRQATWWFALAERWRKGHVRQAVFLAFSIELWQTAQSKGGGLYPTAFPFCVPRGRPRYQAPKVSGDVTTLERGDSPTHAGALVYLPPRDARSAEWIARFAGHFEPFGAIGNVEPFSALAERHFERPGSPR